MEYFEDSYSSSLIAEEVAMKMAEAVAILVVPHEIVVAEGGVLQCASRESVGETICEITQTPDQECFDAEYEFVAEVVEECSTIGRLDVINLWERVIFAWVIGDAQQGMLSFSLHESHAGLFALAPISRLAPMSAEGERELALSVNAKRRGIRRADFVKGALESPSLKSRALNIIFSKFIGAIDKWREIINASQMSEQEKQRLLQLVEMRLKMLEQ
ncbi:MAG: HipA domain-containing protein [Rikenellaceae bacterium]